MVKILSLLLFLSLAIPAALPAQAQAGARAWLSLVGDCLLPLGGSVANYGAGAGFEGIGSFPVQGGLEARLGADYGVLPLAGKSQEGVRLSAFSLFAGLGCRLPLGKDYEAQASLDGGFGLASLVGATSTPVLRLGAGLALARLLSPDLALTAGLGLRWYSNGGGRWYEELYAGASLGLGLEVAL